MEWAESKNIFSVEIPFEGKVNHIDSDQLNQLHRTYKVIRNASTIFG